MKFEYKGTEYDTDENNRLQLTTDKGLKQAFINKWFGNDEATKRSFAATTKEDWMFDYALLAAKSESINMAVTSGKYSAPGTYPEWVIESFETYVRNVTKEIEVPEFVFNYAEGLTEEAMTLVGYVMMLLGEADKEDLEWGGLEYPNGYKEWLDEDAMHRVLLLHGIGRGFKKAEVKNDED